MLALGLATYGLLVGVLSVLATSVPTVAYTGHEDNRLMRLLHYKAGSQARSKHYSFRAKPLTGFIGSAGRKARASSGLAIPADFRGRVSRHTILLGAEFCLI